MTVRRRNINDGLPRNVESEKGDSRNSRERCHEETIIHERKFQRNIIGGSEMEDSLAVTGNNAIDVKRENRKMVERDPHELF